MDIKGLKYFIAVAEELNIGRAAKRLKIAQPPLSRQIAAMEDELGIKLLDRSRSQIQLTQAGRKLRDKGRQVIEEFEVAVRETKRVGSGVAGRISIAFIGSASYSVLPELVGIYREKYPEVQLDLQEMNYTSLQRALIQRETDIAVARPGFDDDEFRSEQLCVERFVAALPELSNLSAYDEIMPVDLANQTLILSSHQQGPSYAAVVVEALAREAIEPLATEVASDFQAMLSLVSLGAGVALVPELVATSERRGLVFRPYRGCNPGISLSVHARLDNRSPQVFQFLNLARKFSRSLLSTEADQQSS